jgi:hypothetical protein
MSDLTVHQENRPMISADEVNPISMMFDPTISDRVKIIAQTMAQGRVTVPEHLRNNVGDCLAIVMQAASWRLNPFAVAQKTHLVQGRLGYEAQLVSAVVSSLGLLNGRFRYDYIGDWSRIAKRPKMVKSSRGFEVPTPGWSEADEEGLGVRVIGKLVGDEEPRDHQLWLVQAWPRNSTLWATNPSQQLSYLAVKQWVRKYAPDAILGVYTPDELQQEQQERPVQGVVVSDADSYVSASGALSAKAAERPQPQPVPAAPQPSPNNDQPTPHSAEKALEPEPDPTLAPDLAAAPQAGAEKPQEDAEGNDEWPQPDPETGELVDVRGCPWIESVHSAGKTCTQDGYWRRRRGVPSGEATDAETAKLDALANSVASPDQSEPEPEPEPEQQPEAKPDAPSSSGGASPMAVRMKERINVAYQANDAEGLTVLLEEIESVAENGNISEHERDRLLSWAADALDALSP